MNGSPSHEEYKTPSFVEQARHLINSSNHGTPQFSHNNINHIDALLKRLGLKKSKKPEVTQALSEAQQEIFDLIGNGQSRSIDISVIANNWSGSMLITEVAKADLANPIPQDCLYFVRIMQGDDEGEIWLANPYTKELRGYELEHFIFSADRGLIEHKHTEDSKQLIERYQQGTSGYHYTEYPAQRLQSYLFNRHDPDYPYDLASQD